MKHQTIFSALFQTPTSSHDRAIMYNEKKDLAEFMDWAQIKRKEISDQTSQSVVMISFKIERFEYD